MRSPLASFFFLALRVILLLHVQVVVSGAQAPNTQNARANVSIEIDTTFPDSAVNTVGIFYNGRTSRVDISIKNKEPNPILVNFIGGAFQDAATLKPVLNLTSKAYNSPIQANSQQTFPFSIQAYFPGPRVLHLSLVVQFTLDSQVYNAVAHDATVTIADPPQSIFDPQAWFLYLILASAFTGVAYLIYSTWLKAVLPKKTRAKKDVKKREPAVVTNAASNYEEWIPQHHLKKESTPAKKRKGGGRTSTPASGSN